MTTHNDHSINLLVGLGLTSEVAPSGGPQENVADDRPLFGDVLSGLLMSWPGGTARPRADGDMGNVAQLAATAASMPTPTSEIPSLFGANASRPLTISIPQDPTLPITPVLTETSLADEDASPVTSEHVGRSAFESTPCAIDRNIVAFNNDIMGELPVSSLVSKVSARPAVDGMVADLPSGRCEIITSQVSDGNLNLTLAGSGENADPVQVRIPMGLLTHASDEQASIATGRVDLGVNPKPIPDLEQLLAKLNVKQLEVVQGGFDDVESRNPVKIVLTGEASGRTLSLEGLLRRGDYHSLAAGNQSTLSEAQASAKDPAGEITRASRQGEPLPKQPVAEPLLDQKTAAVRSVSTYTAAEPHTTLSPKTQDRPGYDVRLTTGRMSTPLVFNESTDPSLTPERTLTGIDAAARETGAVDVKLSRPLVKMAGGATERFTFGYDPQSADPFTGLNNPDASNRIDREDITPRMVRFNLPDDLQTKLIPNGQSVSIRIEPEHLGPARLSLTISHDRLRARVTVESFEAKVLIERSLDRLTQQLTRAGVEVDRIEVTVDGRQSGDQLFERRPQWRRPTMSPAFGNDIESEFNQSNTTPLAPTAYSYVGAGGVNMLA